MTRPPAPEGTATVLCSGGAAIVLLGLYLYVTGLSRAAAVWMSPLGAVMLVAGAWAHRSGRPPHRRLLVLMGVAALALVLLGLVTLIIALQAANTTD